MRARKPALLTALALALLAPLPVTGAISAAAAPTGPSTLGLDGLDDIIEDTGETAADAIDAVTDPVKEILKPDPQPEPAPPVVPQHPSPPSPVVPAPAAPNPAPPTSSPTVPEPAPPPVPAPTKDSESTSGGSDAPSGPGDQGSTPGRAESPEMNGADKSEAAKTPGAAVASSDPTASSFTFEGAPLLPGADTGDPGLRSILLSGGERHEAISPVADERRGSIAGLLALGGLATVMLYGCAAYLKFSKRRPAAGRHTA